MALCENIWPLHADITVPQYDRMVKTSLGYPDSVRWQHFSAPQLHVGNEWPADVTARAALPQIRVEMLISGRI